VIGGWREALRHVGAKRLERQIFKAFLRIKALSTYEIGDLGFTCGLVRKDGRPAAGIGCSAKAGRIGRPPRIKNA
jgi:hypothetical protein